jgi:hypothetical protein
VPKVSQIKSAMEFGLDGYNQRAIDAIQRNAANDKAGRFDESVYQDIEAISALIRHLVYCTVNSQQSLDILAAFDG